MTAAFSKENGWPFGEVMDTDPLYEKEKQIPAGHPVRDVCRKYPPLKALLTVEKADILVTDLAKSQRVTSLIVVVPLVCESIASYLVIGRGCMDAD